MRGPNVTPDGENAANPPATLSTTDREVDFSEYMWMGDEMEEFDRKCLLDLAEEDFIEQSFDELHREEEEFMEELEKYLRELNVDESRQLDDLLDGLAEDNDEKGVEVEGDGSHLPYLVQHEVPVQVELNPYAAVFVPYNLIRSMQSISQSESLPEHDED